MEINGPPARAKRRVLIVSISVLAAAGLVLATEVICRRYVRRWDPQPEFYHGLMTYHQPPLDYGLRPNHAVTDTAYGREVMMKINSYGFRYSKEPAVPKPAGLVRIFVVGGSAAFGLYVYEEEMFSGQLELYLKKVLGDDKVEVINAAVPGYTTQQELQMLVFRVLPFDPDLVILYDGFNDMAVLLAATEKLGRFGFENELMKQMRLRRTLAEQSPYRLLYMDYIAYSGIARMVRHWRAGPAVADTGDIQREPQPESVDFYGRGVRTMAGATRGHGSDFIVAFQPHLFYGEYPRTPREMGLIAGEHKSKPKRAELFKRYTPRFAAAARDAARSAGARFVDLTDAFKDAPADCLLDLVHPSPYGHLVITRRLLEEIESILTAKNPAGSGDAGRLHPSFAQVRAQIDDRLARHAGSRGMAGHNPGENEQSAYLEHIRYHLSGALAGGVAGDREINRIVNALEVDPANGYAHYDLGNLLLNKGHFAFAASHLEESIRRLPDNAEMFSVRVIAHNNAGYALHKAGRQDEAIAHLQEALRMKPDYARAHYTMGLVCVDKKDAAGARKHFSEALRLDPQNQGARAYLEKLNPMMR